MFKKLARRCAARLTYANVVATMALFIALGGVSYAAVKLPKNSVTSKAIKKNAVTNAKIKRSAVTSNKIKNGTITGTDVKLESLTGAQINESTLAGVASAATATDTFNFLKVIPSSSSDPVEDTARAAATPVPIVSNGTVSVYAKCFTSGSATHFELIASTTASGATMDGYSISDSIFDSPTLNVDTTEDLRQITDDETDSADDIDDDYAANVSLLGPDGKGIFFSTENYARFGNPSQSPAYLPDNSCAFHVNGSNTK